MSEKIQAVRGMNDILPETINHWQYFEAIIRKLVAAYGYQEIRTPILEKTELFKRSIGEVTDIVEKEMYTFNDRSNDSLTMRPEGTAGCVRAVIEHGLAYNQTQRLWYLGPIFRHERPQKGRYRQFYQVGVEAFGFADPDIDAEMILMSARLWKSLGIEKEVTLHLNSLGSVESRNQYRAILIDYFKQHEAQLDEDSQRRLHSNPLRILDSKNPDMQTLIQQAPQLTDYLDETSQQHFQQLKTYLDEAGISYKINPRLVRGLDYYTDTVYEWITESLGAQGTICAGGRYDGLVAQLGGQQVPAVGFAMGCERIIELLQIKQAELATQNQADVYFILAGDKAKQHGVILAEQIRNQLPNLRLLTHCGEGSFKSQFKKADKSGAKLALILGDDEIAKQSVAVKFLREQRDQQVVKWPELYDLLNKELQFK